MEVNYSPLPLTRMTPNTVKPHTTPDRPRTTPYRPHTTSTDLIQPPTVWPLTLLKPLLLCKLIRTTRGTNIQNDASVTHARRQEEASNHTCCQPHRKCMSL